MQSVIQSDRISPKNEREAFSKYVSIIQEHDPQFILTKLSEPEFKKLYFEHLDSSKNFRLTGNQAKSDSEVDPQTKKDFDVGVTFFSWMGAIDTRAASEKIKTGEASEEEKNPIQIRLYEIQH